jgi:proteasome lid subunit RPN8/RPN11
LDSVAGSEKLTLLKTHLVEMLAHVKSCLPEEACGLIASSHQVSRAVYPIPNELRSPHRFRMNPVAQLEAFLDIEKLGWVLAAIYHSHPEGPPEPSETDLVESTYPGVLNLIWHTHGASWSWGCYVLSKDGYETVKIHVGDDV